MVSRFIVTTIDAPFERRGGSGETALALLKNNNTRGNGIDLLFGKKKSLFCPSILFILAPQ